MSDSASRVEAMLGWDSFDGRIVEAIRAGDPGAIIRGDGGEIRCPIAGCCGDWLPWSGGIARNGTAVHGEARARFRSSPTFIYEDAAANLPLAPWIADAAKATGAAAGSTAKAETGRLGYENSEDAVTANVFAGLHDAQLLGQVAEALTGYRPVGKVQLYLWGSLVDRHSLIPWPELPEALDVVERHIGAGKQRTEPDACLHIPGFGWVFIEAKLTSATSTYEKRKQRLPAWVEHYGHGAPDVFRVDEIPGRDAARFPEQILRNVAVAAHLGRTSGEQWRVVGLFKDGAAGDVVNDVRACLTPAHAESFTTFTWEGLHALAAGSGEPGLAVRRYLERKSTGLLAAFPSLAGGSSS